MHATKFDGLCRCKCILFVENVYDLYYNTCGYAFLAQLDRASVFGTEG